MPTVLTRSLLQEPPLNPFHEIFHVDRILVPEGDAPKRQHKVIAVLPAYNAEHTLAADIVVAAAGSPGLVTADMVAEGAALLDVGITRTADGLVGDLHPSVWEKAAWVAPMPGGVGPMTRAMLLANVVERAEALAR